MNRAASKPVSPAAIVRHGLTRHERIAIARRDARTIAGLDGYDATTINEICRLCDEFAHKHATYEEMHS